jgi:uncharacterized protein YcbK (DUF882 family)
MEQPLPVNHAADRRGFLRWTVSAVVAACTPMPAWAAALGTGKRRLSFSNLHTGENLTAVYWSNGTYERNAVDEINHLLRDFRTGDVHPIDLSLLDLLHVLQRKVKTQSPFQVISGYRSPATNAKLASASHGVARRSYHMKGMAIDVALDDRKLSALRDAALSLKAGGVGYYPKPGFIHVDVGPVRRW